MESGVTVVIEMGLICGRVSKGPDLDWCIAAASQTTADRGGVVSTQTTGGASGTAPTFTDYLCSLLSGKLQEKGIFHMLKFLGETGL